MNADRAASALAGACFASVLTGACSALTTIQPGAMLVTAIVLALSSRLERSTLVDRMPIAPALFVGFLVGLTLPANAPPTSGRVLSKGVGASERGDLFDVLNALDNDPAAVIGTRASVSGIWTAQTGSDDATLSRRIMNCCAADAISVGFDVELAHPRRIEPGAWVRIEGTVRERMRDGELRYVLDAARRI